MCKEVKAQEAGGRKGGKRKEVGSCVSQVRGQKLCRPQAALSGTLVSLGRHLKQCSHGVTVLISKAPVCATHNLLAAHGSGSDTRDSTFGISS